MALSNVEYVREHGPATLEELPNVDVSYQDEVMGLQAFTVRASGGGDRTPSGGSVTRVFYLGKTRKQSS